MINKIISSGKRKRAVARAVFEEGTGNVSINKKGYKLLHFFDKLKIEEPLRIAEKVLGKLNFNVAINVKGGGEKGQIEASRVALSKGIVAFSKSDELEKAYLEYDRNLLVADVRRKETRKPGAGKARSRRQKSYR
ncbi:MAG: 30S ribosomal protein S9 [Nanoarchaeota archaeon]